MRTARILPGAGAAPGLVRGASREAHPLAREALLILRDEGSEWHAAMLSFAGYPVLIFSGLLHRCGTPCRRIADDVTLPRPAAHPLPTALPTAFLRACVSRA